jgi:C4-dicarboxylate-binding protein DctP
MQRKRLAQILFTAIIAIFLCQQAFAKDAEFVMKFGTTQTKKDHWTIHWTPLEIFKKQVEVRSNGRIKVEVYQGSQLGSIERTIIQAQQGIIQASLAADGHFANMYPNIQVFGTPYLFIDRHVAWHVLDGKAGKMMIEDMAKKVGLRSIGWLENGGFRHYSNSVRPIRKAADMNGLKIRTMNNPMHMEIVKQLGASPTPISWNELYTSLQTGVVDGQENAISVFRMPKLEEVQKYIIMDGHVYGIITFLINEKWYQSLPTELKHAINQAADITRMTQRTLSLLEESRDIQDLRKLGIDVYDPPIAVKNEFKKLTQEPCLVFLKEKVDKKWTDLVLQETEKAEKQLGYRN